MYSARALTPHCPWFTSSWCPVGFGCLGPGELQHCFSLCVSITSITYDFQVLKCLFLLSLGHSYDLFYSHILNQEMITRKTRSEQQEGKSSIWVVAPTAVREMSFVAPESVHPYPLPIPHPLLLTPLLLPLRSFYSQPLQLSNKLSNNSLFIVFIAYSFSLQSYKSHEGTGVCLSCSIINLKFLIL